MFGVLGPNGAGKTATLRMLAPVEDRCGSCRDLRGRRGPTTRT
ncbi:hypothetical protein [Nonomuraea sp. LPB2021202275-12-8]